MNIISFALYIYKAKSQVGDRDEKTEFLGFN